MECRNHPSSPALDRCVGCLEPFCHLCLVNVKGQQYCASCKVMALGNRAPVFESMTEPCKEADEALKYAIIGLFCFGIILEPIALSKANTAKKMIAANPNLTGSTKATVATVIAAIGLGLWIIGIISRVTSAGS